MSKFKVVFTLDESDANYFRSLYRRARRGAKDLDAATIIAEARGIVKQVRAAKKTPSFVIGAIEVLTDLVDLIQDEEYAAPKRVRDEVLAGLAYFANPEDLIPDHVPGLGFLDDAIMVELVVQELRHDEIQHRVSQILEPLVGFHAPSLVRVHIRSVLQRLDEKVRVPEAVGDAGLQTL